MDACRPFADCRSQLCQLELAGLDKGHTRLRGAILDAATRDAVLSTLAAAYPEVSFGVEEVTLLRREPATMVAVASNLTGLHAGPGFATAMATQGGPGPDARAAGPGPTCASRTATWAGCTGLT